MLSSTPASDSLPYLYTWRRQFPQLQGLGWPLAHALMFIETLKHHGNDFDRALLAFREGCLGVAYGPVGEDGTRSYVETARMMKRVDLTLRPPPQDFAEQVRLAVTPAERRLAHKEEEAWYRESEKAGKLFQVVPPPADHRSWQWLVAWVEGHTRASEIAPTLDENGGVDERTIRNTLEGRAGKRGGLLHHTGLLVNGHFPVRS